MRDWFDWNGVRCTTYGIHVSQQPPITFAGERVTFTDVPGRSGSLTVLEGEDVYSDITMTAQCFITDESQIAAIGAYLKGGGNVTFANRPEGYYKARIINQIPLEQVMRGRLNKNFAVNFRCKPFLYVPNETPIHKTVGGNITNGGNVYSEPIIKVTGSGDVTLMVGTTIIELTGIDGHIIINSELQEAYKITDAQTGTATLQNDKMAGEFPRLTPGLNGISWTGTVSAVDVTVNTRYR